MKPFDASVAVMAVLFAAWALWLLVAALIYRMEFSPEVIRVRTGLWRDRRMRLDELAGLTVKGRRRNSRLLLVGRRPISSPKVVSIDLMIGFDRRDEWGPLLLEAVRRNEGEVDQKAMDMLTSGRV